MKLINEKIIKDLKESLGLQFLDKKKQDEIITRMLELVSQRAGSKIITTFSDDETKEFNEISKDNLEQMEDFLILKNQDAEEIFKQEVEVLKKEILSFKKESKAVI